MLEGPLVLHLRILVPVEHVDDPQHCPSALVEDELVHKDLEHLVLHRDESRRLYRDVGSDLVVRALEQQSRLFAEVQLRRRNRSQRLLAAIPDP